MPWAWPSMSLIAATRLLSMPASSLPNRFWSPIPTAALSIPAIRRLSVSQLTYNTRNLIGRGSLERNDDGLSDFGVSVVKKMNALGMAIDVSHCGDKTSLHACQFSTQPVLVTHSNCRALNPGHP